MKGCALCYKNLIARREGGKGATRHRVEHISRRKQLMINLYRNNKQTFFEIDKSAPEIGGSMRGKKSCWTVFKGLFSIKAVFAHHQALLQDWCKNNHP
jgi:hypothetical protein